MLTEVALTEAEQMKLATKRSMQQTHISQASRSGADEGTGIIPGVPDVPTYEFNEEISWKSSDEDDDDDVDDQIDAVDDDDDDDDEEDENEQDNDDQDSDNDGDDFIYSMLTTHDEEAKDEKSFDRIVQTLSHVENFDDEGNDDASHGMIVGGDEGPDAEDDDNELYRDVNINLEGRDVQMTDVHTTQVLKDTHVTLTLVNPDGQQQCSFVSSKGMDSLFESNHRVDVPVTTTIEPLLLSAPTLPPPSIPIISQVQQASVPLPTTVPSKPIPYIGIDSIYNLNIESTPLVDVPVTTTAEPPLLFATTLPSPSIHIMPHLQQTPVPSLANVPSSFLQDLPHFGSLFDHRLKTLEINFSKFMQTNQFAKAISSILDTVKLKRRRDDEDKDEEPFTGLNRGSKRRRAGKEQESTKEPMHTTKDLEEPAHQEFDTGATEDQPVEEALQHPDWFQTQAKPPTPDHAWNKTLPTTHGHMQPWINNLAQKDDSRTSFNELMDTPLDFSAFMMNQLKVDTLTPELLACPTYELMKGSCKRLVELEFFS
nr:hypothetical protein [Tanacetum cinerariifolium]